MNPVAKEFDLVGELTEDFKYIKIYNAPLLKSVLKNLSGIQLQVTIKPYSENRSARQNRYFWGVIIPTFIAFFKERDGVKHTPDEVYTWVRLELLGVTPKVVTIMGQEVIVMEDRRFSSMTKTEFAEKVDLILSKAAEMGCYIQEPRGQNNLHEILVDE